jgi:ankyrin repeat protein
MLAANPEIERDPWASLVLGHDWEGDPNVAGGPLGWPPLVYVCHSCFGRVEPARALLERGADPNGFFVNGHGRMSALYGAAGRLHDPGLTRLLLEAGASPDDGESLYHSTEADSPECLRLLLEHGASTRRTNALAHALDDERIEHVRLLLDADADANAGALVAHAVRRGRGSAFVRLLAEHGADLDRPGGETWRGKVPLRTPYQHAVLRGRTELAETLAELGANTDLDPADAAVAAVARGERPEGPLPERFDPDAQEVVILNALRGHLDLVVELIGPDFRGVVGGSPEGSLLHHAAWIGSPELVGALLERGADPRGGADGDLDTPLGWAVHGSGSYPGPEPDFVAVAELLVDAGNRIEPQFADHAEGPLAALLERRLGAD